MDDVILPTNLSPQPPSSRNPLRWLLDWGLRNPVMAGWLGACLFILVLVYVQVIAQMVERGDDDGGDVVALVITRPPMAPAPADPPAPPPAPSDSAPPAPAPQPVQPEPSGDPT